jgi:FOG: CBS domain
VPTPYHRTNLAFVSCKFVWKKSLQILPYDATIISLLEIFSRGTHRGQHSVIQYIFSGCIYTSFFSPHPSTLPVQRLHWHGFWPFPSFLVLLYCQRSPSLVQYCSNSLQHLALSSVNMYTSVVASRSSDTVLDAMKLMSEQGVSSVAVVEDDTGTLLSAASVTDIGRVLPSPWTNHPFSDFESFSQIVVPSQSKNILSMPLHQFVAQIKVRWDRFLLLILKYRTTRLHTALRTAWTRPQVTQMTVPFMKNKTYPPPSLLSVPYKLAHTYNTKDTCKWVYPFSATSPRPPLIRPQSQLAQSGCHQGSRLSLIGLNRQPFRSRVYSWQSVSSNPSFTPYNLTSPLSFSRTRTVLSLFARLANVPNVDPRRMQRHRRASSASSTSTSERERPLSRTSIGERGALGYRWGDGYVSRKEWGYWVFGSIKKYWSYVFYLFHYVL